MFQQIRITILNNNKMTTFKISFEDSDTNEVYSVAKQFDSLQEAIKYADLILATTSDDCISFTIHEI